MTPPDRRARDEKEQSIQRSLTLSWKEGIAAQVMIGIVDYFTVPFALLLGASNTQIATVVALPNLLASVVPMFAVRAVTWTGGRLRLLTTGLFIQALFLMPIGFLSYLHVSGRLLILAAFIAVYKTIGGMLGPAWGSLVSEYLPAHRRGHYFGWRSRIVGISGLVNLCAWGVFLWVWKKNHDAASGFLLMFLAASLARLVSCSYMSRMTDLPTRETRESEFTFWMFLRRFRESNFVKFVFYVSSVTFATNIASPYFSVHMLKDLNFSYLGYMMISLASVVTGLLMFPVWGRHADSVGNAKILKITSIYLPFIPIIWMFPRTVAPLVVIELFSGVAWGGFNLCATNFIYDAVTPEKRVRCLSYFNFINGVALCAGAWLGGWLSDRLPPTMGFSLLTLFAISAAARFLANFFLSRQFREVRAEARPVTSTQLFFSVVGIRPIIGRNEEIPALPPSSQVRFGPRPGSPAS
ncbi:MAG: MFS transporter [Elusimicrobia bacterium]|nr:MFS transporter [Elusimicrobiota bacterium]